MNGDDAYLRHVRDAIRAIDDYTREGRDHFFRDRRTQDAVIRNLEMIGEGSKALSNELRERTQDLPWRRIVGVRRHDVPFGVHQFQPRSAGRARGRLGVEVSVLDVFVFGDSEPGGPGMVSRTRAARGDLVYKKSRGRRKKRFRAKMLGQC